VTIQQILILTCIINGHCSVAALYLEVNLNQWRRQEFAPGGARHACSRNRAEITEIST